MRLLCIVWCALHVVASTTRLPVSLGTYLARDPSSSSQSSSLAVAVQALAAASIKISDEIRRLPLRHHIEDTATHGSNASGDRQRPLDVLSNDIIKQSLTMTGIVRAMISEEDDDAVIFKASDSSDGPLLRCYFDPLDGSSNIDCGVATGTIFALAKHDDDNLLQTGSKLLAAGYIMYSSSTELVLSMGNNRVVGFTLNPDTREYVMTRENIRIPRRGTYYSLNEGRSSDWPVGLQNYVQDIKDGKGRSGERYSSRYICSMVADFHRTLLYGGWCSNPRAHLRLLYEVAPLAFLCEQSGGLATDGVNRLLDICPSHLHHKLPCFLGSKDDIEELMSYGDVRQLADIKYKS
jgi:fructose-1,6-bisphosphatase I